jgi:EAL domain-containing protein (putative c-di-GMP-specific phosphodiesterase class I)
MLDDTHVMEVESKIRRALEEDRFFFNLQPQFDMNHKLRGFEALARMKDENGKIVSPGEFIPVAEKAGLVDQIDHKVLISATAFIGEMVQKHHTDAVLSVNASVRHLLQTGFVDEVREALYSSGLPAEQLEIEITESVMIDSVEKAIDCIHQLAELGVRIAIDDFGTGYSSLSYLNKFPADALKIDKSFIDVMNDNASNKQYVGTIISIGHILNLTVISEGVESQGQLDTLKEAGCDCVQGFVWGKPLAPEEAAKLM